MSGAEKMQYTRFLEKLGSDYASSMQFGATLDIVVSFNEKPEYPGSINIGYFIFDKKIFKHIHAVNNWLDLINILIEQKQLFSFEHDGVHITINTLNELALAEKSIDLYLDRLK